MAAVARLLFDRIYAALDASDFATAQQLCQHPEVMRYPLAHALLSYSLAGQRKYDVAVEVANALWTTSMPQDDSTISALLSTYKLSKADNELARFLEQLMTASPNAEYALELFAAYARQAAWKKMQVVAQRLHKLDGKTTSFLMWSATCMLMQEDLPPTMWTVAERTAEKAFTEAQDKGAETAYVYVMILVKQGKAAEALRVVRQQLNSSSTAASLLVDETDFKAKPEAVVLSAFELSLLEIDLLLLLKDLEGVYAKSCAILQQWPEQYNVHTLLLHLVLCKDLLAKEPQREARLPFVSSLSGSVDWVDDVVLTHRDFAVLPSTLLRGHLQLLEDMGKTHAKARAPPLAFIQLLTSVLNSDLQELLEAQDVEKTLTEKLTQFVDKFLNKPCLLNDIKSILCLLQKKPHLLVQAVDHWRPMAISLLTDALTDNPPPSVPRAETIQVDADDGGEAEAEAEEQDAPAEEVAAVAQTTAKGKKKKNRSKKGKGKNKQVTKSESDQQLDAPAPIVAPERIKNIEQQADRHNKIFQKITTVCNIYSLIKWSIFAFHRIKETEGLIGDDNAELRESLRDLHEEDLYANFLSWIQSEKLIEERNILPVDELMVNKSSTYRLTYHALSSRGDGGAAHQVSALVHWLAMLCYATEKSPYSSILKIDKLEVCRDLGLGDEAWSTFSALGVKHVQNDSMSYLINPTLIASGCWASAIRQYRILIIYHRTARREALENLAVAFRYRNYAKALELKQFVHQSQHSLQLALAKAELPLLELAQNAKDEKALSDYIKEALDLSSGSLEAQSLMSDAELQQLVFFSDVSLMERLESEPPVVDIVAGKSAAAVACEQNCRSDFIRRILCAQAAIRVLSAFLTRDAQGIAPALDAFAAAFREQSLPSPRHLFLQLPLFCASPSRLRSALLETSSLVLNGFQSIMKHLPDRQCDSEETNVMIGLVVAAKASVEKICPHWSEIIGDASFKRWIELIQSVSEYILYFDVILHAVVLSILTKDYPAIAATHDVESVSVASSLRDLFHQLVDANSDFDRIYYQCLDRINEAVVPVESPALSMFWACAMMHSLVSGKALLVLQQAKRELQAMDMTPMLASNDNLFPTSKLVTEAYLQQAQTTVRTSYIASIDSLSATLTFRRHSLLLATQGLSAK